MSAADWSSSVYRPATRTTSTSVSVTKRVGLAQRLLAVVVGVVDERDVDPVQAQPAQARLEAAADAVGAVVESPDQVAGDVEPFVVAPDARAAAGCRGRLEQPADLGGDHVLVPRPVTQGRAEPALGPAEAVVRRGVEEPDAAVPGRVDRRPRVVVGHRGEQVPDRRAAERDLGHRHPRAPELTQRQNGAVGRTRVR
jgi:hypothetical protein